MKKELYFKKKELKNIDDLIVNFNSKEFKSPLRSTIPLLQMYNFEPDNSFGLIDTILEKNIKYIFEYETPVLKGKGRASCTDLMIVSDNSCIAIEAKWTEPPYQIIKNWLGESENKKLVLEGWVEIISEYCEIHLDSKILYDLPYQLIHRVASACLLNKSQSNIVYLIFELNKVKKNYYEQKLSSLSKIIGHKVNFYIANYKIEKLDEQRRLENLWNNKERDLSKDVIAGLLNNSLIIVSKEEVKNVSNFV